MSPLTPALPVLPSDPQILASWYPWPGASTVRANMIASLDGRATLDGVSGGLGSPADQRLMAVLRATADVLLVGAGTVRTEGYQDIGHDGDLRATLRPERPAPVGLAVVTRAGLPDGLPALRTAAGPTFVLTTEDGARRTRVGSDTEVVVVGDEAVDPERVRSALIERVGDRILCEGGPSLLTSLLAGDVVDELCLTRSPHLLGAASLPVVRELPASTWHLVGLAVDGDHLFTRHARTGR